MIRGIKLICFSLMCTISLSLFAGCATNKNNSVDTAAKDSDRKKAEDMKERVITDAYGHEVKLPEKVDSAAVGGALNQVMLMLGCGDKIGVTAEAVQKSFFATVYPRIKEVPAAYISSGNGEVNIETLLKEKPQVIFATNDTSQRELLESAGVAVVGVKLVNIEDMENTFLLVGKVLGEEPEKKAKEFVKYYENNINNTKEKTKNANKVKVFVAAGDGANGEISTIPEQDINTLYIGAAGGVNIVAEHIHDKPASGNNVSVDFEFILKDQPDVIIANSKAVYDYIVDKNNGSQWQDLDAVKNGKVYLNPKGVYLWSVRSAEGALQPLWLGKILHPDLFQDLDIRKTVKDFYKTYYNYDLHDKETDDILSPKA